MIEDCDALENSKVTGVAVVAERYSPDAAFVAAITQVPDVEAVSVTVAVSDESVQLDAVPPAVIA